MQLTQSPDYIGHDKYEPIWAELNRRKAVVFLHGAQTPSSTPYPHPYLGVPITEVSSFIQHNSHQCLLAFRCQTRPTKPPLTLSSLAGSDSTPLSASSLHTWEGPCLPWRLAQQSWRITWAVKWAWMISWRTFEHFGLIQLWQLVGQPCSSWRAFSKEAKALQKKGSASCFSAVTSLVRSRFSTVFTTKWLSRPSSGGRRNNFLV